MPLPLWRKLLFGGILLTLVVVAVVFSDTMAGACSIMALIGCVPVYAFNRYADMDLAQQFDNGKNTEGWK